MDFPLYFQKVMLLWQGSIVEIDYVFFRVFGPYFIGKSLCTFKILYLDFGHLSLTPTVYDLLGTFKILIFGLWSFIPPAYRAKYQYSGLRIRLLSTYLAQSFTSSLHVD